MTGVRCWVQAKSGERAMGAILGDYQGLHGETYYIVRFDPPILCDFGHVHTQMTVPANEVNLLEN